MQRHFENRYLVFVEKLALKRRSFTATALATYVGFSITASAGAGLALIGVPIAFLLWAPLAFCFMCEMEVL